MTRGRKRANNPNIPAHIDQELLPRGCYWDNSGTGRWYIQTREASGKLKNQRIAGATATLADLHRIVEEWKGVDRNTLNYVAGLFEESARFKSLSASTQKDYRYCRSVVCKFPSRTGQPLGTAPLNKWTPATTQKLVDKLAEQGTPSKANHVLRYLRRMFKWAVGRDYIKINPAGSVEQATERKLRTMPSQQTYMAVLNYAKTCGGRKARTAGSCAPYIWIVLEIAYLCRLRGIEVITLTDDHGTDEGLRTNRRKGSRDNVVAWSPRLRAAWAAAKSLRDENQKTWKLPTQLKPAERWLFLSSDGQHLRKSSLDTAWQRFITSAIENGIIAQDDRFSLHSMKRKGITDTEGTRPEKQLASGHKTEAMLDVYDRSLPRVRPAADD